MSKFECPVVRIDAVEDHPNADRLSIVKIAGFNCISAKLESGSHRYAAGDFVVYIPEGAVLPEWILQKMGFWKDGAGTLAGSKGNRVKAMKLRDVLSQGVLFPVRTRTLGIPMSPHILIEDTPGEARVHPVDEGDDCAEVLGITKYEPEIPASMSGEAIGSDLTLKFDLENGQKHKHVFEEGEDVVVTEKLHGTFCAFVFTLEPQAGWLKIKTAAGPIWTTAYSKGLGQKGLVFLAEDINPKQNVYVEMLHRLFVERSDEETVPLHDELTYLDFRITLYNELLQAKNEGHSFITILGEIYGKGVQDLTYSLDKREFAMFGYTYGHDYQNYWDWEWTFFGLLSMVPRLYEGPFSMEKVIELRDGKSAIDGKTVREGVVVIPTQEGTHRNTGRKALKFVSTAYLTRKGGTEYN